MVFKVDEFETFLKEFKLPYKLHNYSVEKNSFKATLQTALPKSSDYGTQLKLWIQMFSEKTQTNWIVREVRNMKRKEYKVVYACQHSSCKKTLNISYKLNENSRDKKCKAAIHMEIKKATPNTLEKDKDGLLKQGMNAVIKVNFTHSHLIDVAESYRFLRVSDATKELFIKYFDDGMSASSARSFHSINIFTSEDHPSKAAEKLSNAQLNPTERQVTHLFENWRFQNLGTRDTQSVFTLLSNQREAFEKNGGTLFLVEHPFIAVILTPIMKRCHQQKFSDEIVFVDSSGSCDQTNTCVTFLFGASKVGGLPLGCILHTSQTEENYRAAFSAFREAIGAQGFNGKKVHSVFMTDDSVAERTALRHEFPSSRLLLCSFHVCQAMWRWLWDSKNQISKDDRSKLMILFRNILFSTRESHCDRLYAELENNDVVKRYPSFYSRVQVLWERQDQWAICRRRNVWTRGHNTNNFVEASIRVFKDIVLQRCKVFNAVALVEYIVVTLESYHARRLLEFSSKRTGKNALLYSKLLKKSKNLIVEKDNGDIYRVLSSKGEFLYTVDVRKQECNCDKRIGGAFCKHLCAVHHKYKKSASNSPELNCKDRFDLAKIALGSSVDIRFYRDMTATEGQDLSEAEMDDTSHDPMEVDQHVTPDAPSSEINSKEMEIELRKLRANHLKIEQLAVSSQTPEFLVLLKKWNNKLGKIDTSMQLGSLMSQQGKPTMKRYIGVQPTSQSRRRQRLGLGLGLKRIEAERPSNQEVGKTSKKRKRSLGLNVFLNQPNAKSHGVGH